MSERHSFVTVMATDDVGNLSQATFTVTVHDITPPLITGATYVLSGVNGGSTIAAFKFRADGECNLTVVP